MRKKQLRQLVQSDGAASADKFLEFRAQLLIHSYISRWRAKRGGAGLAADGADGRTSAGAPATAPRAKGTKGEPPIAGRSTRPNKAQKGAAAPCLHPWEHGPEHVEMRSYEPRAHGDRPALEADLDTPTRGVA